MNKLMALLVGVGLMAGVAQGNLIFSEDFGTLANGTEITTENTDFTYVRLSAASEPGSIEAMNPSTVGDGAGLRIVGPNSGSLSGVGVGTGLGGGNVMSMFLSVRIPSDIGDARLHILAGEGDRFTGNNTWTGTQMLFISTLWQGQLAYHDGSSWNDVMAISNGTQYDIWYMVNNSSEAVNGVAAESMSLMVNNVLVGENLSIHGNQAADGFRIYATGLSGTGGLEYEIDDIRIYTGIIPEPGTIALLAMGMVGVFAARRKLRG